MYSRTILKPKLCPVKNIEKLLSGDKRTYTRSFRKSLKHQEDVAVICEFKPASPSMGDISDSDLVDALKVFEESGCFCSFCSNRGKVL